MKGQHILLFFMPDRPSKMASDELVALINRHGIQVRFFGMAELYAAMMAINAMFGNTIVLGLLAGDHAQNCAAARCMRTLRPNIGLLALDESCSDETSISLIQSGVDNVCPATASADLLLAVLLGLLRRYSFPELSKTIGAQQPAGWVLREQAWLLFGPSGKSLSLTTAERAFFLVLVRSADLRATHAALAAAVQADVNQGSPRVSSARLGVMVSRMRRKVLEQQGAELPLKSLHSWGYMFAGSITEEV